MSPATKHAHCLSHEAFKPEVKPLITRAALDRQFFARVLCSIKINQYTVYPEPSRGAAM